MSDAERSTLEAWVRSGKSPSRVVMRANICLLAADGVSNNSVAQDLRVSRPTVILWRSRFKSGGPPALTKDAPHGPSSRKLTVDKVNAIVVATLQTKPPDATHWSIRTMANAQGVSHSSVARIWDAHGLQPHRTETFKLSTDKMFVEKLTDVVGLYMNPPEKALVLCVDEKSSIQALDRTQPGLPMKKGRCGTMTHDYKRNGTTTLFAALNVLDGTVIGSCYSKHRHGEFLEFLRKIDRETPIDVDLHLILDNYATHKHPNVKLWLSSRPRFKLHFIPTSSSWLNLVERWFAEITRKRIRRGTFSSVQELVQAIDEYVILNNENPRPFIWTKTAADIIRKTNRCKVIIDSPH